MKIGIGYQNLSDARTAGRRAAEEALESGSLDRADLVLAFCNSGLCHSEFFAGLQAVFGRSVPIIGGSAIGIIAPQAISYTGHPAGAVAIQADEIRCRVAAADRVNPDEKDAGRRLAQQLGRLPQDRLLLFFYDSIKQAGTLQSPPVLTASAPLIEGIAEIAHADIPIFGASIEEAAEVLQAFARHGCPLFGFYSGVEVAPMPDKSRGLDWTGVLIVLAKEN